MEIRTISLGDLQEKIEKGADLQIVNVLDPKYYELGLIKNSLKIPLDELDDRMDELDRNKEIVVYCASYECNASRKAAEKLLNRGYNVLAYEGGIKEWKEEHLPVEHAKAA